MISRTIQAAVRRLRPRRSDASQLLLLLLIAALVLSACAAAPPFDPKATCGPGGRAAGAYPDLEAMLPTQLDGAAPTSVDSGRQCDETALGSLITHDARGIRYAGATWDLGNGHAATSVVFSLDGGGLQSAWIAEFYEIGARTAKRTEHIDTSAPAFPGVPVAARLDTLNDLSYQSVVTWQDGPIVRSVLVATPLSLDASRATHDALVDAAVAVSVDAPDGP